ncbi:hypothetical protein HED60_19570 [Planctomycetales bacterium ZRK34]|nr:hypothetical protein HED60_19570 [Planctomycetales bacterium ZRK34]
MRDGEQEQFSGLGVIAAGGQGVVDVAFDHAEDGLDLPALAEVQTLAVGAGQQALHEAAVLAGGGFVVSVSAAVAAWMYATSIARVTP